MARIRTLKPETWTDEKFVQLSYPARLLFMGLWNFADDDGRMECSPLRIKLQILPADPVDISELIGEIRGKKMVITYQVDDKEYLQIVNFSKHQKVDKRTPSKFPSPPKVPAESPRVVPTEGNGREGKVVKQAAAEAAPDPLWGAGLKALTESGIPEGQARSFIGMLCGGWEQSDVLAALTAASGKGDPRGYARKILAGKPKRVKPPNGSDSVLSALRAQYGDEVRVAPGGKEFIAPSQGMAWNLDGETKLVL